MKRYTYPAIFVKDEDKNEFNVLFPDLEIVTDGRFVEEAYLYAKASLKEYFLYAEKFNLDYNFPSSFDSVRKVANKDEFVLLVDTEIDEKELEKVGMKYEDLIRIDFKLTF